MLRLCINGKNDVDFGARIMNPKSSYLMLKTSTLPSFHSLLFKSKVFSATNNRPFLSSRHTLTGQPSKPLIKFSLRCKEQFRCLIFLLSLSATRIDLPLLSSTKQIGTFSFPSPVPVCHLLNSLLDRKS